MSAWWYKCADSRCRLAYYTFGRLKKSGFGGLNQHGAGLDPLLHKTKTSDGALALRASRKARSLDSDDELNGGADFTNRAVIASAAK